MAEKSPKGSSLTAKQELPSVPRSAEPLDLLFIQLPYTEPAPGQPMAHVSDEPELVFHGGQLVTELAQVRTELVHVLSERPVMEAFDRRALLEKLDRLRRHNPSDRPDAAASEGQTTPCRIMPGAISPCRQLSDGPLGS